MAQIGVFVCHCGMNIARTVDVERVAKEMMEIPGVKYSTHYSYMCSNPGQNLLKTTVKEKRLDGVVVAACSPHMHELTFRGAAKDAGLNPYLCEIANIREHCSWVHEDRDEATDKAIDLVRLMVEKVKRNQSLEVFKVPLTKKVLIIGGGIAGIQTALDVAEGREEVILVEKQPSIGGHMAQLSETFPTLDCSQCILTPKTVQLRQNPRITLYTYAEVEEVEGFVGNFQVRIRKKAKSVKEDLCTGCGECWNRCPSKKILSEFNVEIGTRTAIYIPFPQAVPNIPVIDRENCRYFQKGKCKVCEKVCPREAIDYSQEDEIINENVGAIVAATGYDLYSPGKNQHRYKGYGEYGYGRYQDVISGLQFERLCSAIGPTGGEIRRPSDGKVPKEIVFIQCVGSRHNSKGIEYCSKICCMYTAKHTILYKHRVPDGQAYVFYMDIRSGGKNYDEFVRRAIEEEGAVYLRGRVSRIYQQGDKVVVKGADTLSGSQVRIEADMVVLATAILASNESEALAQKLRIPYDRYGFFTEAHPKLRPLETNTAGVFLAGSCQAPRDIPDAVSQASGTASKVLGLFSHKELEKEPLTAEVDETICNGCFYCERVCPYNAVQRKEIKDREGKLIKVVAEVNKGLCTGCGTCVATCFSNCVNLCGFTDEQMYAEINALG
ncbi:MAG: 4Fe-4S dicluster domain-containing protein [bacterium]